MEKLVREIENDLKSFSIKEYQINKKIYVMKELLDIIETKNKITEEIIPREKGIYFVLNNSNKININKNEEERPYSEDEKLLYKVENLRNKAKVLSNKKILYIGKATGERGLNQRLNQYIKYKKGKCMTHKGGRAIWQINEEDINELKVFWIIINDKNQAEIAEHELLKKFKKENTVYPFANWRG